MTKIDITIEKKKLDEPFSLKEGYAVFDVKENDKKVAVLIAPKGVAGLMINALRKFESNKRNAITIFFDPVSVLYETPDFSSMEQVTKILSSLADKLDFMIINREEELEEIDAKCTTCKGKINLPLNYKKETRYYCTPCWEKLPDDEK